MGERILLALLALAGLGLLWRLFRIPPAFVIAIRDGQPEVRRGVASERFLRELQLLCRNWGIAAGTIRGVKTGGRHVSLQFSRDIATEHHQRIRNVFYAA